MGKISFEFSFVTEQGIKILNVSGTSDMWKGFDASYLLTEICESLLYSSVSKIRFDFSSISFISSCCFGVMANVAGKAIELNKSIVFKFGKEIIDAMSVTGMKSMIPIENMQE